LPSNTPTPSPWHSDQSQPFIITETQEEIFIAYLDGRYQSIPSGNIVYNGQPWSPDGSQFIFSVNPPGPGKDYYIADLRDGSIQLLEFIDGSIYWSPDGRYLLYTESKLDGVNYEVTLMLYEFETGNSRVLVTIPRRNSNVEYTIVGWSPDSQKIAYVAEIDEQYDLFTIDIETMDSQQLTDDVTSRAK
jgi:Tol biopolymer transport system component